MAYVEIDRNYQVRAAVVFPNVLADSVSVTPETRLEEAVGLARAINLDVAYREIVKLREIKPSAYFSRGFVDRVKPLFETEEIELMIVDASLTPIQQRNLEKALKIKVIDRTALILEIFGERAKTKEGRASGGTGAFNLSAQPAGSQLDTFGTAARRRRFSRRPRRNSD